MSRGAEAATGSGVVNGVTVLFADRPGPVSGGLLFRVGWSDEPLARAGLTHLIEHLALHGRHDVSGHHNATTGESITHFHATGTEAEVVATLNGTCAALRELPLARIETEKEILRTEAAGRSFGASDRQRLERYGARGPGLAGYEGFGLSAITAEDVRDWASEWFVTGNAVMWITGGAIPPNLDLRLPPGQRRPVPVWTDLLTSTPAFFRGARGGILLDAVVPRSAAASLFAKVASRALFRSLREEGGYSYAAQCEYEPIDADSARITMYADALEDAQAAATGGLVDVLAALRGGAVDANDLLASQEATRLALEDPFLGAAMLPGRAMNALIGGGAQDAAEMQRESDAVTVADIAAVAQAVWDDALIQIPEGALDWAGFAAVPTLVDSRDHWTPFPQPRSGGRRAGHRRRRRHDAERGSSDHGPLRGLRGPGDVARRGAHPHRLRRIRRPHRADAARGPRSGHHRPRRRRRLFQEPPSAPCTTSRADPAATGPAGEPIRPHPTARVALVGLQRPRRFSSPGGVAV